MIILFSNNLPQHLIVVWYQETLFKLFPYVNHCKTASEYNITISEKLVNSLWSMESSTYICEHVIG